jgi:hypothetical protein
MKELMIYNNDIEEAAAPAAPAAGEAAGETAVNVRGGGVRRKNKY